MVIRVAAQDVESAKRLVVRLVGLFGGECVSLRADGEVQLQPYEESNRALAQTLDAVEHWLEETGIGSADVWVDERPCRVDRPRWVYQVASAQVNGADSPAKGCGSPALEITGMLDVLPVYGTRAEAIDAVRQPRDKNTERRERWRSSWL
jgi:hypothetical protein